MKLKTLLTLASTFLALQAQAIDYNDTKKSDPLVTTAVAACYEKQYDQVVAVSFYQAELKDSDCPKNATAAHFRKIIASTVEITVPNQKGIGLNTYYVEDDQLFARALAFGSKLTKNSGNIVQFVVDRNTLQIISINANFDSLE